MRDNPCVHAELHQQSVKAQEGTVSRTSSRSAVKHEKHRYSSSHAARLTCRLTLTTTYLASAPLWDSSLTGGGKPWCVSNLDGVAGSSASMGDSMQSFAPYNASRCLLCAYATSAQAIGHVYCKPVAAMFTMGFDFWAQRTADVPQWVTPARLDSQDRNKPETVIFIMTQT